MPNCVGGMTIVQLGADMCNEGVQTRVHTACRQVQISGNKMQTSADSVQTENKVVYTP